jgi:asparagine synthase (glutamine-hydrolysing)
MCGIVGCFGYKGRPLPADVLVAMRDHMAKRGPDGHGLWYSNDRRVGLGHRRLAIIDTSEAAVQPMASADGQLRITFNGEIYNYQALRTQLQAKGHVFASRSDTEVLLHLYAEYGEAMFRHLRGMYAFALWDAARGAIMLARDPYGIKPLYYADQQGCVRFASQVKALLVDTSLSRDMSPAGLVGFHLFGSVPEPHTLYRSIRMCPPGSLIWIDDAGVGNPRRHSAIADQYHRQERAAEPMEPRAALLDSVRHHLVADVEVGAFLSGGIDSGALVGLMRDAGQTRIRAITLGFDEFTGQTSDEVPLASRIAADYGVDHKVRRVGAEEFEGDLPAIFNAMDQPSVDGVNTWFVSKAASELGLKVALSGIGGDELLGGYSTFRSIPRTRRLAGPFASIPFAGRTTRWLLTHFAPLLIRRNPKIAGLLELSGSWAGSYLLRRAVLLPFELDQVMDEDIAREGLEQLDPVGLIAATLDPDPGSDFGRVSALESSNYLRNQLLRDADWAGMAHSLEIRVPLVDFSLLRDIAPFMATQPVGAGKMILANAPRHPLPDSVTGRSKIGFAIPIASWQKGAATHVPNRGDSRQWARQVAQQLMVGVQMGLMF